MRPREHPHVVGVGLAAILMHHTYSSSMHSSRTGGSVKHTRS
jgi:hypothetical protein